MTTAKKECIETLGSYFDRLVEAKGDTPEDWKNWWDIADECMEKIFDDIINWWVFGSFGSEKLEEWYKEITKGK